nr:reverse transcriptase domain-containing protein [Tanacetum cinerariifolium]
TCGRTSRGDGRTEKPTGIVGSRIGDQGGQGGNGLNGCSYKEFLACNPKDYDRKGGAIFYTRWIEKIESVQDMNGCGANQKDLMGKEFCPNNEMQKLETEFWYHAMVGASHAMYTDSFHELARLFPYLVTPENKRIKRYIYGLAPQIHVMVAPTEPTTIQSAELKAGMLTDEAIRNGSLKKNNEKRGNSRELRRKENVRDDNKRSRTGRVFATITNPIWKEYTGMAPKCTNCSIHQNLEMPCRKCTNCNCLRHFARDCRARPRMVTPMSVKNPTIARGACFECGGTDHYKTTCPRLNRAPRPGGNRQNQPMAIEGGQGHRNNGNQAGGGAFMVIEYQITYLMREYRKDFIYLGKYCKPSRTPWCIKGGVTTMMPIITIEEKAQIRLEVKARSTFMMGIPNEHQLKFNSIKDVKQLLEAVEKRFGGNAATKKTRRNLLKQQYENFTTSSLEMLDQTFDRLQKLVSQLELLGEKILQEDVNQKLLRSLSPERNTHASVWRNKADLDTMSMDDLYNNLKVYEPEVKGMSSSSSSTQNMAFVSSSNNNSSNTNGTVNTAQAVNTTNGVSTASTQVNIAYIDNLIPSHYLKRTERKLIVNGNEKISFDKSNVECYNYDKRGHFARECRALRNQDNKYKKSSIRSLPVKTPNSTTLVSCDDLRPKAVVNVVKENNLNVVKASACWVLKPKHKVLDRVFKHNSTSITLKKFDYVDAQGRSKLQKLVSQLELLGEKLLQEDVNQKLLTSLSPERNTHASVWRNKADLDTMSMDDLYNNLKVYEPEFKGMSSSSSSTQNMAFVSSSNNNSSNTNGTVNNAKAVNTANGVSTASTQVNIAYIDNLSGYDWSNQAEEGPNYSLMAFSSSNSDSKVSNNSTCLKSCLETIKLIKSQNEQLLKDLKKSELMVLGNFMPPTPGLSYPHLDEFVNKPVAENVKANSSEEEAKAVRKNNDVPVIKEYVLDDEEEHVVSTASAKVTTASEVTTVSVKKPTRKDTQVPQPSGPTNNVADEAAYKELGDRLVRGATTASSLEAEQDNSNITKTQSKKTPNESSSQGTNLGGGPRFQETIGDTTAQTRFESVSKHSNDLLLARGNILRSDEDRLKLDELMVLCTNLQNRVLDLEKTKTTQHNEIDSLKRRLKKLEKRNRSRTHKLKRLYKVCLTARIESSNNEKSLGEDASKQERRIDVIDVDEDITLVSIQDDANKEMFYVDDLGGEKVFVAGQINNVVEEVVDAAQVSTATTTITITTKEITLAQALKAFKTSKPKKRRNHSAAKRAEEKRNKPPTKAQRRKIMRTYLKNIEGYKLKDLKLKEFDKIQEKFDRAFRRLKEFDLLKWDPQVVSEPGSEMLDQTFDRLQKLVSHLELLEEKLSQKYVNQKLLRSLSPEWNTHVVVYRNKADLDTMSMDDLYNNLKVYEPEVKGMKLTVNGNETIGFDKSNEECYNCHKRVHFAKEYKDLRNQNNKNKESLRRSMPVKTSTSTALGSCDGLGGYDWSDQAHEGRNYALMAFSYSSSNLEGNPQMDLQDQRVIDSGCSRHMIGNMSYLTDYTEINEGYIAFGGNPKGGKITGKCTIKTEAVNTACYVQNRVLVVKRHNKTPYKLFHCRKPTLSFIRPFGCPVTILNTIDHLGKFDGKANEGFFVGYSLNSKAFRVFNSRTRIVKEKLHIRFSESTYNVVGSRPDWLFDIDTLTRTMNYEPIVAGTQSNGFADLKSSHNDGSKPLSDNGKKVDEDLRKENECNDQEKEDNELPFDQNMHTLEYVSIFNFSSYDEDDGTMAAYLTFQLTMKMMMSSMGELTLFLGLQVTQKKDGVFISQDKYVAEILKKFRLQKSRLQAHQWKLKSLCSRMKMVKKWMSICIDGKEIVITESSVRRDLQLADKEGIDYLPNSTIFEQLALMGVLDLEKTKTTQYKEIDSLKRRLKNLEKRNRSRTHKLKRLYKVGLTARVESSDNEESLGGEEVFVAGQNDNVVKEVVDAAQVSTAAATVIITTKEITLTQALEALKTSKPKMFDVDDLGGEEVFVAGQNDNVVEEVVDAAQVKLVERKEKRVGEELEQEITKKQKVEDDKEKEELKQLMKTIPDREEETIDAIPLAVKSPGIVDWKIHKE